MRLDTHCSGQHPGQQGLPVVEDDQSGISADLQKKSSLLANAIAYAKNRCQLYLRRS